MLESTEVGYLVRALRGDQRQFSQLTEPYRAELQVHCYRMLGSLEDAEDLVQETFLRAWRSLDQFVKNVSFRAWLYRIATNACLDAIDRRSRRVLPMMTHAPANPQVPFTPEAEEFLWLEPYPDSQLSGVLRNPEARYSLQESVRLAFMVALQTLPPRQRAVLLLRDVLNWRAKEVAAHLEMSLSAVNSALHRARTTLREHYRQDNEADFSHQGIDPSTERALDQYVQAWVTADIHSFVSLLKRDATFAMPPSPSWYLGRAAIKAFVAANLFGPHSQQRWQMRPSRSNGQPAFGLYEYNAERKRFQASAIQVLAFENGQIAQVVSFLKPALFAFFELPPELEARPG